MYDSRHSRESGRWRKGGDEREKVITGEPAFAPGELERFPPAPKNTEGRIGLRGHGSPRCLGDGGGEALFKRKDSRSTSVVILTLAAVSRFERIQNSISITTVAITPFAQSRHWIILAALHPMVTDV